MILHRANIKDEHVANIKDEHGISALNLKAFPQIPSVVWALLRVRTE